MKLEPGHTGHVSQMGIDGPVSARQLNGRCGWMCGQQVPRFPGACCYHGQLPESILAALGSSAGVIRQFLLKLFVKPAEFRRPICPMTARLYCGGQSC
eukprot:SAG22_NODE_955_length_6331_cov_21.329108_6_plen_98_part_00